MPLYRRDEGGGQVTEETFQSGMPRQLKNYWLHGEGAAKIRWGTPGAFDRCVRNLTQESEGTIADPKGTCANLYHEATGRWPGAHRDGKFAIDLDVLVAAMGTYKPIRWRGPLAPIGFFTDDGRMFPPGTMTFQSMPAPLEWVKTRGTGHQGAVTVGRITDVTEKMGPDGRQWLWGEGDFMNPEIIPEVRQALGLVEGGVVYPSVDLVRYSAQFAEQDGRTVQVARSGKVRAATLVSISAFPDLRLELIHPKADAEPMVASMPVETFVVNASGWRGAPIAPRSERFNADQAVARIEHWAGIGTDAPNANKLASMFLWVNTENKPLLGREGYRLPWGDIIDGKPYLLYHAIYAAAALLEGGHGGLPNIPDADKEKIRGVITEIYQKMAEEFNDPTMKAPWVGRGEATAAAEDVEEWCYCGEEFFCADTLDVILPEEFGDIDVEEFLGKYTESKHPRDPKGTEEGGEWRDVPGHGPHGQIRVGGKWVYPKRHKRTKDYKPKHAAEEKEGRHRDPEGRESSQKKSYRPKRSGPYRYHGKRRAEDARKAEREAGEKKEAPEKPIAVKRAPAKKAAPAKAAPAKKEPEKKEPAAKKVAPVKKAPAKKAAPDKAPVKDKPLPPGVSKFYSDVDDDLADFIQIVNRDKKGATVKGIAHGVQGINDKVTFPDGTTVFSKRIVGGPGNRGNEVVDKEQLGSMLGRALGLPTPRTWRDKDDHMFAEWIDGDMLMGWRDSERRELYRSEQGLKIALLDLLTGNIDGHNGNMMIDQKKKLSRIDFGYAWQRDAVFPGRLHESDFVRPGNQSAVVQENFTSEANRTRLRDHRLSPADIKFARERLEGMRDQFKKLGHENWLDYSLKVLDYLAPHAKGKKRVLG